MPHQMQFEAHWDHPQHRNDCYALVVVDKDLHTFTYAHNTKHYRLTKTINVEFGYPGRSRTTQKTKKKIRPEHDERRKPER